MHGLACKNMPSLPMTKDDDNIYQVNNNIHGKDNFHMMVMIPNHI